MPGALRVTRLRFVILTQLKHLPSRHPSETYSTHPQQAVV